MPDRCIVQTSRTRRSTLLVRNTSAGLASCLTIALLAGSAIPGGAKFELRRTAMSGTTGARSTGPAPGAWTSLATKMTGVLGGSPTLLSVGGGEAYVLFGRQFPTHNFTYYAALIASDGAIAESPFSIFGTSYWGVVSPEPTLVPYHSEPLVVFSGIRSNSSSDPYSHGCIVGALGTSSGTSHWTLEPWSLSANCDHAINSAAVGPNNVLAAGWPGGWATGSGVRYHVGTSSSIPAAVADGEISLNPAAAEITGTASDLAGNGHFYVAWVETSSSTRSGYWVEDVTSKGAPVRAPGSGIYERLLPDANLAITNTNTHSGVYVAYCKSVSSTCAVQLWRVGATSALTVPGSTNAGNIAISAGPDGRIWVAWYNGPQNTVSVVRTNEADTRFGPVVTYATPCGSTGLLGLSGGGWGRVSVALQCPSKSVGAQTDDFVTQAITGLAVTPRSKTISNDVANVLVYKVTDAGDPVSGATVNVAGHSAETGTAGTASISIPKGAPMGTFKVTASGFNYTSATGTLVIGS